MFLFEFCNLNPIYLKMWGQFVHAECKKISEIIGAKSIIPGIWLKVGSYNGIFNF